MDYGLIGCPLGHSFSPMLHGLIAEYSYELCELPPQELERFLRDRHFRGINVTIPYKQAVLPYLDEISPAAARIGAVNTIVNRGGKLCGYNTDYAGMSALLTHMGAVLAGKKVLILGTGGTSRTAHAVAAAHGAAEILHVSRSGRDGAVDYDAAVSIHRDAHFLINTTPVGMYPKVEGCPLHPSALAKPEGILDAVYRPLRTNLVLEGQSLGIPAQGGLYMLAAQAVHASALFTGIESRAETIGTAYRALLRQQRNLVLIGMPSCGKSTVGRLLSAALRKPFVDTDERIAAHVGMPVSDFLRQVGEPRFRQVEAEIVARSAMENGLVLATGGGVVLDPANRSALKRNGLVIFLDRSPDKLVATPDRPLSSDRAALLARYEERYPLYRAAADLTVDADGTPESVAQAILEAWNA